MKFITYKLKTTTPLEEFQIL